ncbi:hypothetical protein [Stutzerimonas nitrititolerans]|uniref:hypothetical protein n=2 Tax=Stutzerimonas nitrititolerans TaxID=2482751 RepID=UPI0028A72F12|nr:hypothetical protein [Stutzerimonas nitrititolerans]
MATDLDPEKQPRLGLRAAQPQAQPQPQLGMTLTPEQQRRQRIDSDMQRASSRIAETKLGLRKAASAVGDVAGSAYGTVLKAGTAVPRGLYGIATGETPVTFSNELPDYTNRGLDQRRAGNFVKENPEQAEAARLGLRGIADRASSSAIGAVKDAPPAQAAPIGAPGLGLLKPTSAQPVGQGIQDAVPPAGASDVERSSSGHVDGAAPRLSFQRTSVGGVVGRVGQDGTLEFSNAAGDVAGADDNPLPAGRMGNGVGGLSVGEPGDSQLALDRFQRANDIRAQTIQDQRRGQIGENGGLTIVRDSTRSPSFAELQNERLGLRRQDRADRRESEQARLGLRHRELDTAERTAASELGLRERELAGNERLAGLEEQRLGLQMRTGEMELAQQQRIEDMREQLADPNLDPATRAQLERAYNALTTPAKDRYMLQDSIMGYEVTGAPILGKSTLDVTTGQMVGQSSQQASQPSSGAIQALQASPERAAEFDRKYGVGAAARYLNDRS